MRRRRASLLVALFLLTSAAMAHAECAWVLWSETMGDSTPWKVIAAWSTESHCDAERLSAYKSDGMSVGPPRGVVEPQRPDHLPPLRLPPRHRGSAWGEGEVRRWNTQAGRKVRVTLGPPAPRPRFDALALRPKCIWLVVPPVLPRSSPAFGWWALYAIRQPRRSLCCISMSVR